MSGTYLVFRVRRTSYGAAREYLRLDGVFQYPRWDHDPRTATPLRMALGCQWAAALDALVITPEEIVGGKESPVSVLSEEEDRELKARLKALTPYSTFGAVPNYGAFGLERLASDIE